MIDANNHVRERLVTWQDPRVSAAAVRETGGLEFLQRIVRGELPPPPMAALLGMSLETVEEGRAVFTVEPAEYHYNPIGVVHGGLACTILDSAMACAVQTTLPVGVGYTTLELKVNLVRAITHATGKLWGEGKVVHAGSRVGTAEGRLLDAAGKLYAHGVTTCMILKA